MEIGRALKSVESLGVENFLRIRLLWAKKKENH